MQNLSPESQVLLQLSRQDITAATIEEVSRCIRDSEETFDWGRLLHLAALHRVAPLVGWQTEQNRLSGSLTNFEPAAQGVLWAMYLHTLHVNEVIAAELPAMLEIAATEGIEVAVRKGGHLAFKIYRDPGLHPMSDVDFLARLDDAHRLADVLKRSGFAEGRLSASGVAPLNRRQQLFWHMYGSDLPKIKKLIDDRHCPRLAIDINVSLTLPGMKYSIPVDSLLERAVRETFGSFTALVLAPEDTVIDLCFNLYKTSTTLRFMHLGKHRKLLKYVDLMEYVRSVQEALSWPTMIARSVEYSIEAPMYYTLAHLDILFPGEVPNDVISELRGRCPAPDDFLSEYGRWDLGEPQRWHVDFPTRFFDWSVDRVLPPSKSLV